MTPPLWQKVKVKSLSHVRLFVSPWTVASQAPLSMGFFQARILEWLAISTSKVMLKILQARLQQYVNQELPDVQAGFRKGRGTRDQIVNIHWIIEKNKGIPEKHLLLLH